MKKKLFYLFTLLTLGCHLQGCAQTKKNELQMKKTMTNKQMIDSMKTLVQKKESEPQYIMHVRTNASYIIKINDLYEKAFFWDPRALVSSYITAKILKSGKQILDIEIYPSVIVTDDKGKQNEALIDEQSFNLIIEQSSWNHDAIGQKSGPKTQILEFDLKKYVAENEIKLTDEKVIKVRLTFDANVPYNFADNIKWKDLRKMDRKELEKRVRKFYKDYGDLYEQKDFLTINNVLFQQSTRVMTSLYYTPSMIEQAFNAKKNTFEESKSVTAVPIDETNTELEFFNHGKLVMLMNNDKANMEPYRRPASMIEVDEEYAVTTYYNNLYLGIPEGEDEFVVF